MSKARQVMFIGKAGSGKTCLIRALQGCEFSAKTFPSSSLNDGYAVNIDYPVNICEAPDLTEYSQKIAAAAVEQKTTDICMVMDGTEDLEAQFNLFHNFYLMLCSANMYGEEIPLFAFAITKNDLPSDTITEERRKFLRNWYGTQTQIFSVSATQESADLKQLHDYFLTAHVNLFEKAKEEIARIMESYIFRLPSLIPTWSLRMFNHRHNERAIAIQESINNNAKSFEDIYLILKNQKALFDREEVVIVPANLVLNTELTSKLVNQPVNSLDSGYYNKIMECINYIINLKPALTAKPATVVQYNLKGS